MKAILLFLGGFIAMTAPAKAADATALFAGGCFWCIEAELQEMPGVKAVTSGYTGGERANPTYAEVSTGKTGHYEAVEVAYDPAQISYERLVEAFWDNVDPTDAGGQMYDRGSHYRTAIFYQSDEEKRIAEASKARRQTRLDKPIVTAILPAKPFYPAEAHHQDYYRTNSAHYNAYKKGSRREETLEKIWKK